MKKSQKDAGLLAMAEVILLVAMITFVAIIANAVKNEEEKVPATTQVVADSTKKYDDSVALFRQKLSLKHRGRRSSPS